MKITKNKISIALCTYNGAKFLPAQLESILEQTRLPDKVFIGDDCSTDETLAVIKNFSARAPFQVIVGFNPQNVGSTANFQQTIVNCEGELIFLADQDDVWLPEKIERIEAEFDRDASVALVFSDAELVDENLEPLNGRLWDYTFPLPARQAAHTGKMAEIVLNQNVVTGATAAFRFSYKRFFLPIPKDVPNLIHDSWIALILANVGKIKFIEEPLIKYRQHASQQLGLNIQAKAAKGAAARERFYEDSIRFLENEKTRLSRMREFLPLLPRIAEQPEIIEKFIQEKDRLIKHYEARKNLPRSRLRRLLPLTNEILSGRYHHFSRGFLSSAKDLFEKW